MSTKEAGGTNGLSPEQMRVAITGLSSPDSVESPFGRLEFFDGVPTADTVSKAYDALDLMRGIEVFLNAVPGASLVAMRRGLRSAGVTSGPGHRHHRAQGQLEQPVPHPQHRNHLRHNIS